MAIAETERQDIVTQFRSEFAGEVSEDKVERAREEPGRRYQLFG